MNFFLPSLFPSHHSSIRLSVCVSVYLSFLPVSLLYISTSVHPFIRHPSFQPSIQLSFQESLDVPSLICLFLFASSLITSFLCSLFPYFLSSFPVLLKNKMQLCKSLITMDVFYNSDVVSQLQKKRSTMPFPLTFQFCKYTYFLLVKCSLFHVLLISSLPQTDRISVS